MSSPIEQLTRAVRTAAAGAAASHPLPFGLLKHTALPPLHGVPFSVKEPIGLEGWLFFGANTLALFDLKCLCPGMPHSCGLIARRSCKAKDATVVRRLRQAGVG